MSVACPAASPPVARFAVPPGVVAVGVVLASFALNLVYLAADCPHDLAPDEAHYWDWSRQLDWAYYSKGPLVAWLIRASCRVFGDTPFGVRFPTAVCAALSLAAVYRLAADHFGPRVGLHTLLVGLTLPLVSTGATVMTIDAPLLACWAWAAVAVRHNRWTAAGLLCGVGVLAKPTMLLFPACVGLWLLASGRREPAEEAGRVRRVPRYPGGFLSRLTPAARRGGFLRLIAPTLLGLTPQLYWNATHGWVSLSHLGWQGTGAGRASPGLLGPPVFVATQAGVLLGFWLIAGVLACRRIDLRTALLWWLTVPVWLLFAAVSLSAKPQANWPAVAYVGGLPLAVAWATHPARSPWVGRGLVAACGIGVAVSFVAHFPAIVRPALARLAGPPTATDPAPVRRFDPSVRLAGWQTLAKEVDRLRNQVGEETGDEPLVAGMSWTLPGELAFYCDGHPTVYCFSLAAGERHSQYDVWRPNPTADAQAFRGRAFIYVGELNPDILGAFDRVGPPVEVNASDGGIPVNRWVVRACFGFRGFPADTAKGRGF